jgi:hypothetical protein
MSLIRSRITLILASLLISVGGGCGGDTKKAEPEKKETTKAEPEKKETTPAEPKGPGGVEMK